VVGRFCGKVDDIAAEAAMSIGGRRFLEPVPTAKPPGDEESPRA
jgi:hypothetical protein